MTDIERAFLAAIAAEPDADVHRLVYADWLDEQAGEATPRGEFIRVQCELAQMVNLEITNAEQGQFTIYGPLPAGFQQERLYDADFVREAHRQSEPLRRRERELLNAHRRKWFALSGFCEPWSNALDDVVWATGGGPSGNFYFGGKCRRGFISRIALPSDDFLRYAADIIEAVPMLEEVRLRDKRPWNSGNYRWGWSCSTADGEYGGDFWVLPSGLFDRLPMEGSLSNHFSMTRRWYQTEIMAREKLSVACLTFARDQLAQRKEPRPGVIALNAL